MKGFFFVTLSLICQSVFSQEIFGPDDFKIIEEGSNGFFADLDAGDRFSRDHDVIGDVNGDGVLDLVVGARSDDDGGVDVGAVYILFMNNDGTVQSNQKISATQGNFTEELLEGNFFGYGVAGIGDYDSDGVPDIAVSAPVPPNNSLYVIYLFANGTVKSIVKNENIIAQGLSAIGDINNDGRIDLVACDPNSNDGGLHRGAVHILFLNQDGMVMYNQTKTISTTQGGLADVLSDNDNFGGREVAMLGDLDSNGSLEMAVGAFNSHHGKGAIWILSLNPVSWEVENEIEISEGLNGFSEVLLEDNVTTNILGSNFGHALIAVPDLNGDGTTDIITGANQLNEGTAYILYMNTDLSVKSFTRIHNNESGFDLSLEPTERFSRSLSFIGDLRNDGTLAVNCGGGAGGTGTLYLLFFQPCSFEEAPTVEWGNNGLLYSNWNEMDQVFTNQPLSVEQCLWKSFEWEATYVSYSEDGKCACFNEAASFTTEGNSYPSLVNGCEENILFVESTISSPSISVYPNPTDGVLTISHPIPGQRDWKVYTVLGQCVMSLPRHTASFDLTNLEEGMYIISDGSTSIKVMLR